MGQGERQCDVCERVLKPGERYYAGPGFVAYLDEGHTMKRPHCACLSCAGVRRDDALVNHVEKPCRECGECLVCDAAPDQAADVDVCCDCEQRALDVEGEKETGPEGGPASDRGYQLRPT